MISGLGARKRFVLNDHVTTLSVTIACDLSHLSYRRWSRWNTLFFPVFYQETPKNTVNKVFHCQGSEIPVQKFLQYWV
jgi:hypothetical protein